MCLYSGDDLDGDEVVPDVYFSSEKDTLEHLVERSNQPFRIFSGYAGWGAGQLEAEMQAGGWLTSRARWEDIFREDDDALWQRVTRAIGSEITDRALRIRNVPADPRCN
jgi:putative transcriptional regulator